MASETISMWVVVWWYSRRLEKMWVHFVCHKPLSLGVRIFHLLSDMVFFLQALSFVIYSDSDQDKKWDGLGTLFLHFIVVSPSDTFYSAEAFEFPTLYRSSYYINVWYYNIQTMLLNRHNIFFWGIWLVFGTMCRFLLYTDRFFTIYR